jgi:hypothetical protein
LRLFAAGLFLLLKDYLGQIEQVAIDMEYVGHEGDIRGMLLRRIYHIHRGYAADRITFHRIGKKSPAHTLAWEVNRGLRQPDRTVTVEELLEWL